MAESEGMASESNQHIELDDIHQILWRFCELSVVSSCSSVNTLAKMHILVAVSEG